MQLALIQTVLFAQTSILAQAVKEGMESTMGTVTNVLNKIAISAMEI